jgi:hypothetical protein
MEIKGKLTANALVREVDGGKLVTNGFIPLISLSVKVFLQFCSCLHKCGLGFRCVCQAVE